MYRYRVGFHVDCMQIQPHRRRLPLFPDLSLLAINGLRNSQWICPRMMLAMFTEAAAFGTRGKANDTNTVAEHKYR